MLAVMYILCFVSRQKNSRRRGSSNAARAPRIMRARALVNFDLG